MTVEIRELVIRAVVAEHRDDEQSGDSLRQHDAEKEDQQALIAECVNQVLKIIQKNKER